MEQQWLAQLALNDSLNLPFQMSSHRLNGKGANFHKFVIHNAEEQIALENISMDGDTTVIRFDYFDSEIRAHIQGSTMQGFWCNYAKGPNYRIPFTANRGPSKRFESSETPKADLSGQWATVFSPGTPDSYPAVGEFYQSDGKISGTFMTLTGDYRYLEGQMDGRHCKLSCFDGAHAFLFAADVSEDGMGMSGQFWSGNHWQERWEATFVETLELPDANSLTKVVSDDAITFSLPNVDGEKISLSDDRFKGKVVILQILGTWCPNCLDETDLYQKVYNKHREEGLEIIALAYESNPDPQISLPKLKNYKENTGIEYELLLAGKASKKQASTDFPMLSEITSFPTSIIIDRKGNIRRVHTGFNGPATSLYGTYVREFTTFVKELLEEQ